MSEEDDTAIHHGTGNVFPECSGGSFATCPWGGSCGCLPG
jgi:hypothetical protein